MNRPAAAFLLLIRFPMAVIRSGWSTALQILLWRRENRPALVPYFYEPGLGETGAVILSMLITLTPGTTAVDLDPENRRLLLHVLDPAHAEATFTAIRQRFEAPVRALFGETP